MAITRRDEILGKVLESDNISIPRYDIYDSTGEILHENVTLKLKNEIIQEGTPINKAFMDEVLGASGLTEGSATAYTLAQEGFPLVDGIVIRMKLHVSSGTRATLNVNGSGAKPITDINGAPMPSGIPSGTWVEVVYNESHDAYVVQSYGGGSATVLTGSASSVTIPLPDGPRAFHIKAAIKSGAPGVDNLEMSANVSMQWYVNGVSVDSSKSVTGLRAVTTGTSVDMPLQYRYTYAMVDLMIARQTSFNGVTGIVSSDYGVAAISTGNASQKITQVSISSFSFAAGSSFVLEAIG